MALYRYVDTLRASRDPAVRAALDLVYREFFPEGTIERIEIDDSAEFQAGGRDVRVVLRRPRGLTKSETFLETIEEKIRRPDRFEFKDLLLEYLSNAQRGTLGWSYTSAADWLCYVKQPPGRVVGLILPMQALKEWFAPRRERYRDPPSRTFTSLGGRLYETRNKVIPLRDAAFCRFMLAHSFKKFDVPLRDEEADPDDLPF